MFVNPIIVLLIFILNYLIFFLIYYIFIKFKILNDLLLGKQFKDFNKNVDKYRFIMVVGGILVGIPVFIIINIIQFAFDPDSDRFMQITLNLIWGISGGSLWGLLIWNHYEKIRIGKENI